MNRRPIEFGAFEVVDSVELRREVEARRRRDHRNMAAATFTFALVIFGLGILAVVVS